MLQKKKKFRKQRNNNNMEREPKRLKLDSTGKTKTLSELIDEGLVNQRLKAKRIAEAELGKRQEPLPPPPLRYPSALLGFLRKRELNNCFGTGISRFDYYNSVELSERINNIKQFYIGSNLVNSVDCLPRREFARITDLSYHENHGVIYCNHNSVNYLSTDKLSKEYENVEDYLRNKHCIDANEVLGTTNCNVFTALWRKGNRPLAVAAAHANRTNALILLDISRLTEIGGVRRQLTLYDLQALCWNGSGELLSCGSSGIAMHCFDTRRSFPKLSYEAISAACTNNSGHSHSHSHSHSHTHSTHSHSHSSNRSNPHCHPVCMSWNEDHKVLLFGLRNGTILMADDRADGARSTSGSCSAFGKLPFRMDHLEGLAGGQSPSQGFLVLAQDVVGSLQLFDIRSFTSSSSSSSKGRVLRVISGSRSESSIRPTDSRARFHVTRDGRAVLTPSPPGSNCLKACKADAFSLLDERTPLSLEHSSIASGLRIPASSEQLDYSVQFGTVAGQGEGSGGGGRLDAVAGFVNFRGAAASVTTQLPVLFTL